MRRFACSAALVALLGASLALAERASAAPSAPLDPTYGDGGIATFWGLPVGDPPEPGSPFAHFAQVDDEGRVVVAGSGVGPDPGDLWRLTASGQPDPTFDGDGIVELDLPGFAGWRFDASFDRIALAGWYDDPGTPGHEEQAAVAVLLDDGTPDIGVDGDGLVVLGEGPDGRRAEDIALSPDGSVTFVTNAGGHPGGASYAVHRHGADGAPLAAFGGDGTVVRSAPDGATVFGSGVAVDGAGRALVIEYYEQGVAMSSKLVRFLPDGSLDPTFGSGGVATVEGFGAHVMELDPRDGGIVVGGAASRVGTPGAAVMRFTASGRPDLRFGGGLPVITQPDVLTSALVWGIAVLPDGRVAVQTDAGEAGEAGAVAVLRPDGSLEPAFGGGGVHLPDGRWTFDGVGVGAQGQLLAVTSWVDDLQLSRVFAYDLAGLPALAPTVTSVEVLDGALSVAWEPAAVELGGPVRGYHLAAMDAQGAVVSQQFVAADVRQTSLPGVPTTSSLLVDLLSPLPPTYRVVIVPYDALGAVVASQEVVVHGAYDPPADAVPAGPVTGLAATAGRSSATVSWVPPADDGGAPIVGYAVIATRAADGSLAAWRNVRADLRTASLTGLTAGVVHDVHVMAVTAEGFGALAPSLEVTPVVAAPAAQPPQVAWMSAVAVSPTRATVSWGPQVERGDALVRFHVIVVDDGVLTAWRVATPSQRQLTIPAGAGASVYVIAESASGYGPWQTTTLPG